MQRLTVWIGATAAAVLLSIGAGSAMGETPPIPPQYFPSVDRDVEVSTSAAPPTATAGDYALLPSLLVNHGWITAAVSFTDVVPDGLAIVSATAANGSCTTSGQTVSCKILISGGESAPVNIVVTPSAAGSYSNRVSAVANEGQRDPNPGNDSASATLTVAAAAKPAEAPTCTVPLLSRTPVAVAKRVLTLLHCKPGKVSRAHSRTIARGQVIRTAPKPGSYKPNRAVALTVSSGPAKSKRHRR